ncbi:MAG TPA: hypothetical protein VF765_01300 [Polyangiaceae bacterium]
MRPLLFLGAGAVALLGLGLAACDQDYAASNADRHSFMGEIHAAPVPSASTPETLPPPALPTTTAAVPTPAPSASTAPAPSASAAPAHSAAPAPAGSGHH